MTSSIQRLFAPLLILVPALALAACGGTDTTPGGGSAEEGAALVKSNGCEGCHTSGTASDGVLSGQDSSVTKSSISGPNLTPDKETGLGSWTDAQIIAAIRTGVDEKGATLCSSMQKYDKLTDDEVGSIVAYLKSIPAVKRVLPEPMCQ